MAVHVALLTYFFGALWSRLMYAILRQSGFDINALIAF